MEKGEPHISRDDDVKVAALQREIETLSQQLKRLVKAESRLYRYQEELDAQLKEYKDLYELSRKINEMFDVESIFQSIVDYLIQKLEYERAILFRQNQGTGDYEVSALGGYYDEQERKAVAELIVKQDAPLLSPLIAGREYLLCTADSAESQLVAFGAQLLLDQYCIYPLGPHTHPHGLLAVGNSAGNALFYRKVDDTNATIVSMGNVAGLVSSSIEKNMFYEALRDSENRLKAIVENLDEGLILIDLGDESLQWNHTALEIYGYSGDEQELASFARLPEIHELLTLEEQVLPVEQWPIRRILRGEEYRDYEIIVRHKKRNWKRIFSYGGVILRDGRSKPLLGLLTIRDITYRKQAEDERERLIADLERSNSELRQFAYVASHDLQEPLRTVARCVELLARRYQGRLDADADKYVSLAVEGSKRMYDLIKDLLAFYQVGTGGRNMQRVPMESVIKQALSNLRQPIDKGRAEVTIDSMPAVVGEFEQLTQLVQNLVDNALKFRKPGATPRVHISAEQRDHEWIFGIHDNGIGMESEYLERIFGMFQRLHPRAEYTGTGMGLAICRKIVEWHGGRIWAESKPGEGSSFYFTLAVKGERHHEPP